jgi:predicted enzyme related to lactoylglutathione lyase
MEHDIAKPESANQIDYVEFQVTDIQTARRFYGDLFGWTFKDYGDSYTAFNHGAGTGGFTKVDAVSRGGTLVVLYADNLEAVQRSIIRAGGRIVREIFSFPGGRRFHFADPSGNELAVWSDHDPAVA